MARQTSAEIVIKASLILEDSNNVIFDADDILSRVPDALTEASQSQPQKVKHIVNITNASREIDISHITGLHNIDYVEYPVGNYPVTKKKHERWGDKVTLVVDTAPSATSLGTLTGTVTFSDGSTAVSGSSTLFTSELEEGWYIQKSTGSTWYKIATIIILFWGQFGIPLMTNCMLLVKDYLTRFI